MSRPVLIVEDNQANQELLSDWLEAEGFAVSSASNLEQAFAALKTQIPCAVLLDVQLGREDGLEVVMWIRRQPQLQGLPVIAVTAHAMITDHERVIRAGCSGCIPKPIDFKLLRSELQLWLTAASPGQGQYAGANGAAAVTH
jgi:two-component system, sensor histidine kinase and response regulator